MISYNEILTVIKRFADGHKFKPRFYSEFLEQLPNLATEDIGLLIFVEPVSGDTGENTDVTEVNVYCLDKLRKDRKNTSDVVSDTKMILSQDLTRWLEEGQQDIDIDRSYPAQPYNNYLLDYTAGWSIRISVLNERISICEVPINDVAPEPVVCDPATVVIKDSVDNTLSTTEFPSGVTSETVIGDTTLTLNTNTFLDVPAEATQDIVLQDQNTDPIVPDSVVGNVITVTTGGGAPLTSAMPLKTSQTTSYRTSDDGDLEIGRATDWLTLPGNNPFGNLFRFTDELGTQVFANGIAIDWATYDGSEVLGWRRTISFATYAVIETEYSTLNIGGFTGWRIPNINEMLSVSAKSNTYTGFLNYPPFNIATGSTFYSSTLTSATITFVLFNTSRIMSEQLISSSRMGIPVKKFTNLELGI